ncbi:thioredoxin domain-containing protein, partial [Acinetobacter baumannii]
NSLVRVSPTGTYVIGNPRAPVKIVEYLSFTCPHCAAFARESSAVLRGQMIRSGSVMIEYRPAVRDQADLAVTLLLKCIG